MNFYTLNRGIYKRLYKYFSDKTCQYENRKEVKKFIKNLKCKPLTKTQKREIKKYYASFDLRISVLIGIGYILIYTENFIGNLYHTIFFIM